VLTRLLALSGHEWEQGVTPFFRTLVFEDCTMSQDMAGMVAVASGTSLRVKLWSGVLRTASIKYMVAQSSGQDRPVRNGHAELWVERDDADEARSAILAIADTDGTLMW
jgi:hypothetical protein